MIWHTFETVAYTQQHGDNPAASGCVTHKQVAWNGSTKYLRRNVDANQDERSYGEPFEITADVARPLFGTTP